ncbi:hypothetical protein [Trichococcus shcherbakoviae]|nr:hypothetical protein [Trichococcus shcherbakoviae]
MNSIALRGELYKNLLAAEQIGKKKNAKDFIGDFKLANWWDKKV